MREAVASWAAAGALFLFGCTLAPSYERPPAPVATSYAAATGTPASATSSAASAMAADLGWRDVLCDARLQALLEIALANNRDLRVAALSVELARARYGVQRAPLLPAVGASGSFTRSRTPLDMSPILQPYTENMWTVGVGIASWELDFFGRLRSLKEQALQGYLATEEARRSAQLALIAGVADAYLALLAVDEQLTLTRQTAELVQASYDLVRRRYDVGQASELDLRTAEGQVQTARVDLASFTRQRALAEDALVLLVGEPIPAGLPAAPQLGAARVLGDLPAGLPSELLQRRPDILAAEHALEAANANIGAARAAFFPSITLTAFGGFSSTDLGRLFDGSSGMWSFAPQVNIPIFTGGRNMANLEAAKVQRDIGVAQYEKAVQVAFREVADALSSREQLDTQIEAETARVAAEERRYQLSALRYGKGVDSYLVVISAQRDLYAAQRLLIQARLASLTNLVELYRALGGGWLERTAKAP
jgi:multidrug efflux system outer membrane protein